MNITSFFRNDIKSEIESTTPQAIEPQTIEQVIASRGYFVKNGSMPEPPALIKETASLLGENAEKLSMLLKQIRYAISSSADNSASIVPKGSAEEIAFVHSVIERLHNLGYLENVRKSSPGNAINFVVTANSKCAAFLNGGWMELWVYETAKRLCEEAGLTFEARKNVKIFKEGETKMFSEHDLLLYVEGRLIWVEAKTGEFIDSLQKYYDRGKALGVVPKYTVLVAAKLTDPAEAEALSYNFDYHICPTVAFEETMRNLLASIEKGGADGSAADTSAAA